MIVKAAIIIVFVFFGIYVPYRLVSNYIIGSHYKKDIFVLIKLPSEKQCIVDSDVVKDYIKKLDIAGIQRNVRDIQDIEISIQTIQTAVLQKKEHKFGALWRLSSPWGYREFAWETNYSQSPRIVKITIFFEHSQYILDSKKIDFPGFLHKVIEVVLADGNFPFYGYKKVPLEEKLFVHCNE